MEWLEMIKVRVGGTEAQGIDADFMAQIKNTLKAPALAKAEIYTNVSVSNDLVIILTWLKTFPDPWGSDLAHRLSQEMKQYGLVDYSAWASKT